MLIKLWDVKKQTLDLNSMDPNPCFTHPGLTQPQSKKIEQCNLCSIIQLIVTYFTF